jgi:hypothetical protein
MSGRVHRMNAGPVAKFAAKSMALDPTMLFGPAQVPLA